MSDYLWDKQGDPDADVERLEQTLRPLAHAARPLPSLPSPRRRPWRPLTATALALAAMIALVVWRPWHPRALPPGWDAPDGTHRALGTWVDTGTTRLQLRVGDLGVVELAPGTRARIVETGGAQERMELARGTVVARVTAPPRRFAIATRHVVATDLGCAFELTVDDAGRGQLQVREGRVALSAPGSAEVEVPAGATSDFDARGPQPPRRTTAVPPPPPPPASPSPSPAPTPPPTITITPPPARRPHQRAPQPVTRPAAPAKTPSPPRAAQPAPKQPPAGKLSHDALKELERSAPP